MGAPAIAAPESTPWEDQMIHASPLPDVVIPEVPLFDYMFENAEALGDKPALIDGPSGRTLTYTQLEAGVRSLAGGLIAHGFTKGDCLALMSPNIPEYAIVFHAVAMVGGVITTVNPTYTEREVHHQLVDSHARIMVTVGMFLDTATAASVDTNIRDMFVIGEVPEGSDARPVTDLFGPPLSAPVPVTPDDIVALPYSSGTTGVSKGVMLTHGNLIANIQQVLIPAEFTSDDRFIAVLPFFHIYGMQVLMNCGLRVGATIVTLPRFDLEQFLQMHQVHGITRSFVAPPIVVALAKHPMVDNFDLSSVNQVFSGAAPLSASLALEAGARIGCEVVQGYGMTELSPVSQLTAPGQFKPGSCGVTTPNTELRIVDVATGADLDLDADGEMWIRGPQVMKGYLNNPEATAATIDSDGWLHTGDIGHVDSDGHVYVVDRLKELIKYKGFQVPPAELEALLLTHPAIADAAVIGRPDEEAGEIPIGFIVLKPGSEATADDVKEFIAGQVATYKRLGDVVFVDAIPKSASGKILRRILRDG